MIYVAMVNRSCREARRSDCLDQTRTGTITFYAEEERRFTRFALLLSEENAVPSQIIEFISRLKTLTISICPSFTSTDLARIARLDGVDFLTMCDESLETHPIHWVFQLLLNLRSVKLDNMSASVVGAIDIFQRLSQNCPKVKFYFLDWFSCMH
jgi:hypothetical protein